MYHHALNSSVNNGTRRAAMPCLTTAAAVLLLLTLDGWTHAASTAGLTVATTPATAAALAEPAVAESKKVAGKSAFLDGYMRTGSHKGDKGYNEDDAYGGKDGDSYGFGTQLSYGNKAGDGGSGAYHESTSYDDNGQSNPKFSAWHFEEKDGKPTKRYVYDSNKKKDPLAVEAEASEYDSVEAYDDDGSHAGVEADDGEPEYGNLYDSADVYDGDSYY